MNAAKKPGSADDDLENNDVDQSMATALEQADLLDEAASAQCNTTMYSAVVKAAETNKTAAKLKAFIKDNPLALARPPTLNSTSDINAKMMAFRAGIRRRHPLPGKIINKISEVHCFLTSQSTDRPTYQSRNLVDHTDNKSATRYRSINQAINNSTNQPINRSIHHPINLPINKTDNRSTNQ